MKQAEKVVRNGNYYEIETPEDTLYPLRISKKEESQSNIYIPPENIITQLPSYKDARAKYYLQETSKYTTAEPNQLLHQLQDILVNQKLADTDKQEIIKMIKEIKVLKEQPLIPLNELKSQKIKQKESRKLNQIELKAKIDIKNIQQKVEQFQKFSYPDIINLEHQLEILLGEKKLITNSSSLPKDDRNKEQVQSLFTQLSNLSSANNLAGLVDKVYSNNGKYTQISAWANNLEDTIGFHTDFLAELKEDELLLNKLQQNFKKNVGIVRAAIDSIKKQVKN